MKRTPDQQRSDLIAMARTSCASCHGAGLRPVHGNAKDAPCDCVCRAVFKAVLDHCRCLVGQQGKPTSKRNAENFLADVWLSCKRVLDETEFNIVRWHYLQGADCKACCTRLSLNRGTFWHHCYRIEERMGLYWLQQLKPYSVFPVSSYNHRDVQADIRPLPVRGERSVTRRALRPPMRKAAPARVVTPARAVVRVKPAAPTVPQPCAPVAMPAPAVVPITAPLAPVPAVVPAPIDIIRHARNGVHAGRSLEQIAKDLNTKAPAPNGICWGAKDVKRMLLDAPRSKRYRRIKQDIPKEAA
jgi:hypothetical protein